MRTSPATPRCGTLRSLSSCRTGPSDGPRCRRGSPRPPSRRGPRWSRRRIPFSEVEGEFVRVGEAFVVPGKDAVAVHVVDVEVDHVARDIVLAEATGNLAHLDLVHVAVAALLVTQRPQGRHRGAASELCVAVQDVPRGRAAEDVVDEVTALSPTLSPIVGAAF